MDDEREDLRTEVMKRALQDEMRVDMGRAKMSLFGSLTHGERGNILAGSLTDNRFTAFWDYVEVLVPYEKLERPEENKKTAANEDTERQALLKEYKDLVEQGRL